MKTSIYIYNDSGVSPNMLNHTLNSFNTHLPDYDITTLDSYSLINTNWQTNASLLIMPGGADLPYVQKLNGNGNLIIKNFVENGGSFLGICAGAYYSSAFVEFDKEGRYEVLGERELKFFPHKSIGPILADYDYFTESGARAAEIHTTINNIKSLKVYYNGGGFFQNAEQFENVQVMANYAENNLPAIIKLNIGNGKVVLSGVHFEVDPYQLDNKDPFLKSLIPFLQESNEKRISFLGEISKFLLESEGYFCEANN